MKLKTFFVFAGYKYYPNAAMRDFKKSFKDYEDAQKFAKTLKENYNWVEIEDISGYL